MSNRCDTFSLTVVLPVHNEEAILERNVLTLAQHLDAVEQLDEFEILLVCDGCYDESERVSAALVERLPGRVRTISLYVRGLGRAIRAGIAAASYDFVQFSIFLRRGEEHVSIFACGTHKCDS
jgi:glycosyltransferase involved in cell wall biosynthesis